MIIDGFDQHCRYLSAPGSTTRQNHFGSFLKKLNISLGEDQLREFVRGGDRFRVGGDLERRLLASFANLGILRNYAAHHDCLDEELSYTPLAETVMEAMLIPTLMVLGR